MARKTPISRAQLSKFLDNPEAIRAFERIMNEVYDLTPAELAELRELIENLQHNDINGLQGGSATERYHFTAAEHTGTGSGTLVRQTSPALVAPSLGVPSDVSLINGLNLPLTTGVTGILPIANGGTAGTTTPVSGGVAYGESSAYAFTAVGIAGQVLFSNGASAPTWGAASVGTVTSVAATAPAAGLTISGSPITTSGTLTFALADDLAAVEALSTTGLATRTAASTWTARTITGTASRITITDGNGVSGNPTIDISTSYVGQSSITTLGTITTGVWNGTALVTTYGGTGLTSYTAGDLAYYASGTTLTKLAIGTSNYVLTSSGTAPQWTANTGTGNVVRASSPSFTTTIGVGGATASASGSGISFPATQSASTDPNTLDDYEEGDWTPADGSGAGLSLTISFAKYVKVGKLVTLAARIVYPATADVTAILITGNPFTVATNSAGTTKPWTNAGVDFTLLAWSTGIYMRTNANADITNVQMSGKFIYFSLQYMV